MLVDGMHGQWTNLGGAVLSHGVFILPISRLKGPLI
jgi:hypothetical protein